jgi:4a-hydroxytetrahydrobiopterin dehydratase
LTRAFATREFQQVCPARTNTCPVGGRRDLGRINVQMQTARDLSTKRCAPCEGGVSKYSPAEARAQLATLPGWELTPDSQRIRRDWQVKSFMAAIEFFRRVAELAEKENHHPDLHLENYRQVRIEIWTHAIGGLSENDFILAAKIDQLPIKLKT